MLWCMDAHCTNKLPRNPALTAASTTSLLTPGQPRFQVSKHWTAANRSCMLYCQALCKLCTQPSPKLTARRRSTMACWTNVRPATVLTSVSGNKHGAMQASTNQPHTSQREHQHHNQPPNTPQPAPRMPHDQTRCWQVPTVLPKLLI
jgi:hypothetical protein